jgi:hypothetical protein
MALLPSVCVRTLAVGFCLLLVGYGGWGAIVFEWFGGGGGGGGSGAAFLGSCRKS